MKVEKRDGTIVDFDMTKIIHAIQKAFDSCKITSDPQIFELLVLRVSADFQPKIQNGIVSVEDIQDSVERILSQSGYIQVAKSYILYRKQRENVRRIENTTLDYKNIVDSYLNDTERTHQSDQPSLYSVGGLILSNSGAITRNYWMSEVYDEPIEKAHDSGMIHIHDLDMLTGDSASWSLLSLIQKGIKTQPGQIVSRPAKHLMTLCNQMVNVLGILQNEWAGAQSFSGFDTYLAPYIRKDCLDRLEVKKALEAFIYGVNIPSRWGSQTPFGNVLFDMKVPADLVSKEAWIGNQQMDFTYGDCQEEMKLLQDVFFEILCEGDEAGNGFPFPIPTVMIQDDFDFENERYQNIFRCAGKYGSVYFVHQDLENDHRKVDEHLWNQKPGFYTYPENSGSIGTVTINLVRLAYLAKDEADFFRQTQEILELSCRSLQIKRQVLNKLFKSGLYPCSAQFISNLDSHFSTIGIVGMNEAGLNAAWLGKDMSDPDTQAFAVRVLDFIRQHLILQQEKTHCLYNLEATPAESVSVRFAAKDHELYPDMPTSSIERYTNSTQLPLENEEDLFTSLEIQQKIQKFYNGGTYFSIVLMQGIEDWKAVRSLVQTIIRSFSLYDFVFSPVYSVCPEHGYQKGLVLRCPQCQKECTIWARLAGYYHPFPASKIQNHAGIFKQNPFDID